MVHSQKKSKGVFVCHYTPIQIMLNKHSTYQHNIMGEICRTAVYPEAEAGSAQYYVANSTGASNSSSDTIAMGMSDGTIKTVPWTLEMYLKCSKIKYPSRARFHCVKRVCSEYYRF